MLPQYFIYIAALINLSSTATYVYETLQGRTRPNRVTWFMWALAPLIATAAQLAGGVGISTLIVFMSGLGPLIIFICSFVNKKAYWETTTFDYICGVLAFCGLVAWFFTKIENYAIAFSILGDFFAAIPTLRKAYSHPQSENGLTYFLAFISTLIGLLCIKQRTFMALGFNSYLTAMGLSLCLIVYRDTILNWVGIKRRK
jgi:hypothetical protein